MDRMIFLTVPHRGSRVAAGILGSIGNRPIGRPKELAEVMRELHTRYPGLPRPYYARLSKRACSRINSSNRSNPISSTPNEHSPAGPHVPGFVNLLPRASLIWLQTLEIVVSMAALSSARLFPGGNLSSTTGSPPSS